MLLTELWDELTAPYDEVGLSSEQEGLLDRRMEGRLNYVQSWNM